MTSLSKDEHVIPQIPTVHDLRHLNQANTPTWITPNGADQEPSGERGRAF